ncbi:MAG: high-potential iron-sulfur protein [Congregibacter sp.]|nr:high-potential iron-sulfur protein [Congregibacter sp.]
MTKHRMDIQNQKTRPAEEVLPGRRRVLEMLGMAAVAVPVLGLQACGSDDSAPAPAASAPAMDKVQPAMKKAADDAAKMADSMADSATTAVEEAKDTVEAAAEDMTSSMQEAAQESATIATDAVARLDENGPQAAGLGYRHDATTVENARYKAGQQCSNCVLYQGGDNEWGGCPLFTGTQVKATGWCSAYSAAS